MRLAVVISHPTQYYSPWFRVLGARRDVELKVFYLWEFGVTAQRDPKFETTIQWDVDLLSGYDHEFVPNRAQSPGTHHFRGLNNPSITRHLAEWRPDALLIFGYKSISQLRVIAWARRRRLPLLFRGDSHFIGRGRPRWSTRLLLGTLFAQFSAFLYVGAANRDYFRALGVGDKRLFFAPHSVNDVHFDPDVASHRLSAEALRTQLGLNAKRVVLFAGKLVPEKQPRELLTAFQSLARSNTALVIVGEGPEKPALVAQARGENTTTVHFLPFANQTEMPSRYLLGDIFALPSRGLYETWGLAVNEAMHMGVPCLVSDRVGCQRDLVVPDETGWVFDATDPADLRRSLDAALTVSDEALATMKANVSSRIKTYTYAHTTTGLLAALESISRRDRR